MKKKNELSPTNKYSPGIFEKISEYFRYGIAGLATTIVNLGVYHLFLLFLDYKISNLIALLASKAFAFISNKLYVFHSKSKNGKDLMKEIYRFILARGGTGLLDYFGLILAVEVLNLSEVWSKYGLQVLVIVLNYVLGKKAVFIPTDDNNKTE